MNALTKPAVRTAVNATGLRKAYGEKVVLDGVDLSIGEGEVFALLGPNGAGKTTTVQILSTLIPADAGTASIMGHDLRGDAGAVRAVIGVAGEQVVDRGEPAPDGPPAASAGGRTAGAGGPAA